MHPLYRPLTIDHLNGKGVGVAFAEDKARFFVPFTLAGEVIRAEIDEDWAKLVSVEKPSPERIAPICPVFGACGGCALQHWRFADYCAWKRGLLVKALQKVSINCPISELIDAQGQGRRRVALHARFDGSPQQQMRGRPSVKVGFMRARSHEIIAIDHCPILTPGLAKAPMIAEHLALILQKTQKPLDIWLTQSGEGLDVDIRGCGIVENDLNQNLIAAALALDLARLSLHGQILVESRPPWHYFGKSKIVPPAGAFLQATEKGEKILTELVQQGVGSARNIVDLFAGLGTFSLPLAETANVRAFEVEASAIAAANHARRAENGFAFKAERRDLFQNPLRAEELNSFEAIVFDPPRAGAEQQARQIAQSGVPRVVGVACDVGNFARDAKILIDGGYVLEQAFAVDQFRYSAHVEIIGYFVKAKPKRKRPLLG